MILPDSAEIRCFNPTEARANAWVSFDGKRRQRLGRGESLVITMSRNPLPTVNNVDATQDWFDAIDNAFHFNERMFQKPLMSKSRKADVEAGRPGGE